MAASLFRPWQIAHLPPLGQWPDRRPAFFCRKISPPEASAGRHRRSGRRRKPAPADLARFIAPKGSVALNGTSLTVNEVEGREFGVNLIAHTKEVTTWGEVAPGDAVNLEIDTLARYVARLAEAGG